MKKREINYGLAFTVCENNKPIYIEINKNLRKYPKLRKEILAHEMLHWKSRSLLDDFKIDFLDMFNFKKQIEINRFCRENPRANLCNLPIFIENGKIIPNFFMISVWSIFLISLVSLGVILI